MDLSQFNKKQKEAVTLSTSHEDVSDILIVAGAGSGKTRVLTHRVAHLLVNEVPPSQILGMTFTRKAANEMQQRLNGIFGRPVPVKLSTFHALSADILRTYKSKNFTIIDAADQSRLIKKSIKLLAGGESGVAAKSFTQWLSLQRNQCLEPTEAQPNDCNEVSTYRKVASTYNSLKEAIGSGVYDFDDLLEETVKLLLDDNSVKKSLHDRWRYILVDEYQDTNKRQFQLLALLRGPKTQLLQVGDEDQLIYSWRGADIQNILSSYRRSIDDDKVRCIFLNDNYRCSGHILSVANQVISENEERTGKNLTPNNKPGDPVQLLVASSCNAESEEIARQMKSWHNEQGIPYDEMATLIRTNWMSRSLERAFIQSSIPYKLHSGYALFDTPEVRLCMSLLWLADMPDETFWIEQVLDAMKIGIGPVTLEKINKERKKLQLDWISYLEQSELSRKKDIKKLVHAAKSAQSHFKEGSLSLALSAYMSEFKPVRFFKEEEHAKRQVNMDVLLDVLEDYESGVEKKDRHPTMLDFQEQRLLNDTLGEDDEAGCVHIMTTHKAKGLEFRCGAVVGLQDGVFPRSREDLGEEDRRLAYVAITRFKESLLITQAHFRHGFKDAVHYSSILSPHLKDLKRVGALEVKEIW